MYITYMGGSKEIFNGIHVGGVRGVIKRIFTVFKKKIMIVNVFFKSKFLRERGRSYVEAVPFVSDMV